MTLYNIIECALDAHTLNTCFEPEVILTSGEFNSKSFENTYFQGSYKTAVEEIIAQYNAGNFVESSLIQKAETEYSVLKDLSNKNSGIGKKNDELLAFLNFCSVDYFENKIILPSAGQMEFKLYVPDCIV
jgi:hypothetical protein